MDTWRGRDLIKDEATGGRDDVCGNVFKCSVANIPKRYAVRIDALDFEALVRDFQIRMRALSQHARVDDVAKRIPLATELRYDLFKQKHDDPAPEEGRYLFSCNGQRSFGNPESGC